MNGANVGLPPSSLAGSKDARTVALVFQLRGPLVRMAKDA